MTAERLDKVCGSPESTLLEVLGVIDAGAHSICCLVDESRRLLAVLTDGDVRRAVLAGARLDERALDYASRSPLTVRQGTPRAHILDIMQSRRIAALPELDENEALVGLHTLTDVIGGSALHSPAVIMAGGRGTRLGELTSSVPKPLMKVAGRSILEWIILGLVGDGIRQIYVSVNYLADAIVESVGTGEALGCRIEYLRESEDNPLSTAGALTLLPKQLVGPDSPPIVVMNGDLMVEFDARSLLDHHQRNKAAMTIGTRTYSHRVPFGVVEVDPGDGSVSSIVEKPELSVDINAAVYCINADLVTRLPHNLPSSMPDLAQMCLDDGLSVSAWPIISEWIDVGTPADLARAKGHS